MFEDSRGRASQILGNFDGLFGGLCQGHHEHQQGTATACLICLCNPILPAAAAAIAKKQQPECWTRTLILSILLTPSVTLACRASAGRSEMATGPKDGAGHKLQQQLNCNLVICLLLPDDYYTALTILLACHPSVASNYVSQPPACRSVQDGSTNPGRVEVATWTRCVLSPPPPVCPTVILSFGETLAPTVGHDHR